MSQLRSAGRFCQGDHVRKLTSLVCGLLLLPLLSCGPPARENLPPRQRLATASIQPLADIVRRVAGPSWTVTAIVPPGRSAHVFEPSPSDAAQLAKTQLVAVVGAGYDSWVAKMAAASAAQTRIHDTSASLGIGREGGHAEAHGDHDEGGHGERDEPADHHHHHHGSVETDPHWWLSPARAAQSLEPLARVLSEIDPAGAPGYFARAAEYQNQMLALDKQIEEMLLPVTGRGFVSSHPAWIHFTQRYGLKQAGSIEPKPGREPSPRELKALIDEARAGGYGVLFTEPQFPASAARIVAEDAGLALALLDPIGGVPGRETYVDMMLFNARSVLSGITKRRAS